MTEEAFIQANLIPWLVKEKGCDPDEDIRTEVNIGDQTFRRIIDIVAKVGTEHWAIEAKVNAGDVWKAFDQLAEASTQVTFHRRIAVTPIPKSYSMLGAVRYLTQHRSIGWVGFDGDGCAKEVWIPDACDPDPIAYSHLPQALAQAKRLNQSPGIKSPRGYKADDEIVAWVVHAANLLRIEGDRRAEATAMYMAATEFGMVGGSVQKIVRKAIKAGRCPDLEIGPCKQVRLKEGSEA